MAIRKVRSLKRGDVVIATRDLDPEGANAKTGTLGVVFEEAEFYGTPGEGPMVRWIEMKEGSTHQGGVCNVYDGQVHKISS